MIISTILTTNLGVRSSNLFGRATYRRKCGVQRSVRSSSSASSSGSSSWPTFDETRTVSSRLTARRPTPSSCSPGQLVSARQKPLQAQTGEQNIRRHGERIVATVQFQNIWLGPGVLQPPDESLRQRWQDHIVPPGQHKLKIETRPRQTMRVVLQVK